MIPSFTCSECHRLRVVSGRPISRAVTVAKPDNTKRSIASFLKEGE